MLRLFVFTLCLLLTGTRVVFAQPDSLWMRTFDVGANDIARAIAVTNDDELLVAGYTTDPARSDSGMSWVLKLDSDGDSIWFQELPQLARVNALLVTIDNGFAVCGRTENFQAGIVRYDSVGNIIWTQTRSSQADFLDLCSTPDNGFACCGYRWIDTGSRQDMFVVKYTFSGNFSWQWISGFADWDQAESIARTTDNDYVVAGSNAGAPNTALLVRLFPNGLFQSTQEFAPGEDTYIRGMFVLADSTDGSYVATVHEPADGSMGFGLARLAANNLPIWSVSQLSPDARLDLRALLKLVDGDLVTCGMKEDEDLERRVFLERRHAGEDPEWTVEFQLDESQVYFAAAVLDSGFVLAGSNFSDHSNTNVFVLRLGDAFANVSFNLTIQRDGISDDILLQWDAIPTAVSYKIYRSPNSPFDFDEALYIGPASTTSFTDAGVLNLNSSVQFYVVTAIDQDGIAIRLQ